MLHDAHRPPRARINVQPSAPRGALISRGTRAAVRQTLRPLGSPRAPTSELPSARRSKPLGARPARAGWASFWIGIAASCLVVVTAHASLPEPRLAQAPILGAFDMVMEPLSLAFEAGPELPRSAPAMLPEPSKVSDLKANPYHNALATRARATRPAPKPMFARMSDLKANPFVTAP